MDTTNDQLSALTTLVMALVQSHPDRNRVLAAFDQLSAHAESRIPDAQTARRMPPFQAAHEQLRIHIKDMAD